MQTAANASNDWHRLEPLMMMDLVVIMIALIMLMTMLMVLRRRLENMMQLSITSASSNALLDTD